TLQHIIIHHRFTTHVHTVSTAYVCVHTYVRLCVHAVIDGAALRIDDRLRVAKERREEADRQQDGGAAEEAGRAAQEGGAETVSCGGKKEAETGGREEDPDAGASSPVAIVISPASPEKPPRTQQVDKRSTSTMNLKQLAEAGINKRLSSSSATLINSPDKSARVRSSSLNRLPRNDKIDLYTQPNKEGMKKLQVEQTGCNPTLLSVGPSLKKRSSSLTRAGGGKTQTPSKLDKGTTDDQGG
ncbi:unnamed protein product, partial [Coregonus sp. 'balchen']